jgi:ABC-2 type transport system ATP-binding protein
MIQISNLTKIYKTPIKTGNIINDLVQRKYNTHTALDHISFEIGDDELVGFIGPNGAGKTTTMKILSGILYPTSGEVRVNDYIPFEKKPAFLKSIAFVMGQKNQMLWELPATDTYKLNKEIYEISDGQYKETVNELIELLDAQAFIDRPVKTLSLGQRMRAELIGALLHRPKILFLDEPTIGLDIFAQTTIVNFINEYQKRYKSSIILTSHYMQDVQRLAKRVILIDNGRIIYDGKLHHLVETYSQEKTVTIILSKKLEISDLKLPKTVKLDYQYPQLRMKATKDEIEKILHTVFKDLEYVDLTVENEPLEEIVKKTFNDKT